MTVSEPLTGPTTGPLGATPTATAGARAAAAGPGRQWRREALSALGDDPRRLAPEVDGYAVGRLLGAGGSGVVWAGTGTDGVERALKVLSATAAPAPDEGPDLLAELALLRRVRHPRVVAVHDISTDAQGRPVLVLDLAPGGSLAGVLAQRRRLSAGEVSGLLHVLGPALEDLHAAGVVHGDVAPGNVLLDARGEPLLADLGVARALGRRHGSVLGTPGFADPAALAGEGVGAASDVYGLAALAWWALTGETPVASGAFGARQAHRRAAAALPAGGSGALLAAVREGLHRKPSRRPTPGELATAVAAAARPRPVRGLPVPAAAAAGPVPAPPGVTHRLAGAGVAGAGGDPEPGPAPDLGDGAGATPPARPSRGSSTGPAGRATARRASARPDPRRRGASRAAVRPARPGRRLLLVAGALPVVAGAAVLLALHGRADAPSPAPAAETATVTAPPGVVEAPPGDDAPGGEAAVGDGVLRGDEVLRGDGVLRGDEVLRGDGVLHGDEVLRGDDAAAVVGVLADRRASALAAGSADALSGVDVAGSAARAADEAVLADLAASGTTFETLAFDVRAVREVERTADRWVLEADVTTAEHVVVSAAGARTTVPAGAARTSRLTLDRVAGEWRVSAVG
ncbi:serine/threonine-protein kinase [Kineococcus endophyticus]|uniref:non-specific serine/threonine protein kinase n=1 Tax=Kineococcus endophyticus TaxID=1181883 RepID=A0ABV3P1B2_9ACTN